MTRISSLSSVLLTLMAVSLCLSNAWASGKSSQTCKKCRSECQTKACECQTRECQFRTGASECKKEKTESACKTCKCKASTCEKKCKNRKCRKHGNDCEKKQTRTAKPQPIKYGPFGRIKPNEAFLWIKTPEDTSVTVNFTEYPPAGTLRFFRTTIPEAEGRKYYVSAQKTQNGKKQSLIPKGSAVITQSGTVIRSSEERLGLYYVLLKPGEEAQIEFDEPNNSDCESKIKELEDRINSLEDENDDLEDGNKGLEKKHKGLEKKHKGLETDHKVLKADYKKLKKQLDGDVTRLFQFDETKLQAKIAVASDGNITDVDFLASPPNPVTLTIQVGDWPLALGKMPMKGDLYLAAYNPDDHPAIQPLFVVKNAAVADFKKTGTHQYTADVPFQALGALLSAKIKGLNPAPAKLHIRGFLRFTFDDGNKRFSGAIGNQIELSLKIGQ